MSYQVIRTRHRRNGKIILAHLPDNKVTPWATWFTYERDGKIVRESGHYFYEGERDLAERDFRERL